MKKNERVKSKQDFNIVINKGKKYSNKYFTIFYLKTENIKNLYGVTCPKRLGNAVIRNRVKRQLRHMIRDTKLLFKKRGNYIIIIKEPYILGTFADNKSKLENLIGEINEK